MLDLIVYQCPELSASSKSDFDGLMNIVRRKAEGISNCISQYGNVVGLDYSMCIQRLGIPGYYENYFRSRPVEGEYPHETIQKAVTRICNSFKEDDARAAMIDAANARTSFLLMAAGALTFFVISGIVVFIIYYFVTRKSKSNDELMNQGTYGQPIFNPNSHRTEKY